MTAPLNEGVRDAVALVLVVPTITLLLGSLLGIVTFGAIAISIARCAYTIWALNAPEVQQWMYKRSMGLSDSEQL